jgi:hypothetical protein
MLRKKVRFGKGRCKVLYDCEYCMMLYLTGKKLKPVLQSKNRTASRFDALGFCLTNPFETESISECNSKFRGQNVVQNWI